VLPKETSLGVTKMSGKLNEVRAEVCQEFSVIFCMGYMPIKRQQMV
jgi:hypothetical protein